MVEDVEISVLSYFCVFLRVEFVLCCIVSDDNYRELIRSNFKKFMEVLKYFIVFSEYLFLRVI